MSELRIDDLTVEFGRGHSRKTAVQSASLTLPSGTTLGLVGESGSGKSSLGRAIVGLNPVTAGTITLGDVDIVRRSARARRTAVQMVFQDPRSSLNPRMSIRHTLTEALQLADRAAERPGTRSTQNRRAAELLDAVSLASHHLDSYPRELSGGQRQRVALARALARDPEVIIADEVTSALDVSVQASILELLVSLQRDRGISMLFISHNLAVVKYLSDSVAVMQAGRIVEQGPAETVLQHPRHEYTQRLRASVLEL